MKKTKIKSNQALTSMRLIIALVAGLLIFIFMLRAKLVLSIYFSDLKTIILNGTIVSLFILGLIHLIKAYRHYGFEEKSLADFSNDQVNKVKNSKKNRLSIIMKRYLVIEDLYHRRVPINHGVISSIMTAEESLYQSFPKFINNVLILTGVFGTIVSLILALVGASSVLEDAMPGEGIGTMLSGMNTALTTSATAIVCYFLYTYFYQRFTDVQTYVFAKVEEKVLMEIIPQFAFDTDTVNHETKELIRELGKLASETKDNSIQVRETINGLNNYSQQYLQSMQLLIQSQESQQTRSESIINRLETIRGVLIDGFRLKH